MVKKLMELEELPEEEEKNRIQSVNLHWIGLFLHLFATPKVHLVMDQTKNRRFRAFDSKLN